VARSNRNQPPYDKQDDVKNSGAWLGGSRGSLPDRQVPNQTTFSGEGYLDWRQNPEGSRENRWPVYPEPQDIRNMPRQIAGHTDAYNQRGQVASTKNMERFWTGQDNADVFLHDIDRVYINPLYKLNYMKSAETADRKEYRARQTSNWERGLRKFANYNSKYFNKEFVVLDQPKTDASNTFNGKYSNPVKTLQLDITGSYNDRTRAIGSVRPRNLSYPKKGRGVDKDQAVGPYQHGIWVNTSYNYSPTKPGRWSDETEVAHTAQHEFSHVLGYGHSSDYDWEDANTVTSYNQKVWFGEGKLLPSDINAYQDIYKQRDIKRRAKNAYKGVAKNRK